MPYPVEEVLDELLACLAAKPNAVLIAPPGAGKTTMVAPAMLNQPWCDGQVLLLSPRRIAARMAAERIAELAGETVGQSIGYATRMDSKQSANTKVLVLTEGIFRNRILSDPELKGVSAVLFDEVHERSLDSDFALALALEVQGAFRPDLRLLAMSATLDGDRFSALMEDAPVIRSEGKSWPLETRYVGRRAEIPLEQDVARIVRLALGQQEGDLLVFLPGAREIERSAEQLSNLGEDIVVHQLHGSLDPALQSAALRPDPSGKRKVILATNIAETSLTIEGVRVVIDCGMARRARYDKAAGVTRLVTERASLSAATQRAGRAARQGPGVAYRMWEEAGNGGLPPFDPPEILESDLTPLLLDCALWLDAIDDQGRITAHGEALAKLPLPPNLAHMVITAAAHGQGEAGATLALLMQERGLGGQGEDLEARMERFAKERGSRADAARRLAKNLAKLAGDKPGPQAALSVGALIATAYPDRIAKRRDAKGESWLSAGGRGLRLDPASPLARADWLAVADMQGAASGARILSGAALSEADILAQFADRITQHSELRYDRVADRIAAKTKRKLGAITLSEGQQGKLDPDAVAQVLGKAVRDTGIDTLPWSDGAVALRQRAKFAGEDGISDAMLLDSLDDWLTPILRSVTRLADASPSQLSQALDNMLGWDAKQRIDRIAPPDFRSPAGTTHAIDYTAPAGPTVELRVQALFGLDVHPVIGAQHIALILSLTSPAGRPIQTTRDLPAFWRGSWRDVAKEMRGRYPKHNWPDFPWEADASLKTKKAQARTQAKS
jgi:ATP-dependent helicase HrpB